MGERSPAKIWGITHITKRYHTGDGQLALRIDNALFYTVTDANGLSLTLINAQGHEAGHVLYNAFGGGRYYDPSLGRPLQPNPAAGPPSVPQALNRYAATSVGAVGVAKELYRESLSIFEYPRQ